MAMVPPDPYAGRPRGPRIIPVGARPNGEVPGGGLTLDALMARQKEIAGRQPTQMSPMISPWQGAASMAEGLVQGLQQRRADTEAKEGRAALAQAMTQFNPETGEFTPEAIATMGALDPEHAFAALHDMATSRQRQRELETSHGWEVEGREDTQAATAEQNDLNRQADLKRQELQDAQARDDRVATAKAQQDLARLNAELAAQNQEKWLPIDPPPGSKPGTMWVKSSVTGEPKMVGGSGGVTVENKSESTWEGKQAESFAKQTTDAQTEAMTAQASLADLGQLEVLAADPNLPGGLSAKAQGYLKDKFGVTLTEGADKAAAFTALVNKIAPSMRAPGSGPMSDQDMQQFLKSLPSLSNTPPGNKAILTSLRSMAEFKIATGQLARQVATMPLAEARTAWDKGLADLAAKMDPLKAVRDAAAPDAAARGGGGDPLQEARDAIARGADPAKVKARLVEMGLDPGKL